MSALGARGRGRTNDGGGGRRARDAGRRDKDKRRGVVAFRRAAHDRASKSDPPPWTTTYAFDANALALNGSCEGGARETREATREATLEVASRGANGFRGTTSPSPGPSRCGARAATRRFYTTS